MKKGFKRLTAFVLALTMILSASSIVLANSTSQEKLNKLVELNVILGDANGVNGNDTMTRYRSITMMLRLMGLEDEMAAYDYVGKPTFNDAAGKSEFVQRLMSYIKAHPELGVVGYPDGTFRPLQVITAKEHAKIMLEVLGYEYGVDYTWATISSKALAIGLIADAASVDADTNFTVSDLANITYDGLSTKPANGAVTLGETLGFVIVTTPPVVEPVVDLAVESVYADNTKQISVVFNKAMDETTAETAANYEIKDKGTTTIAATPKLQADGKTVILTMDGESKLTNASSAKVTVKKDIKDADGTALTADYVNTTVAVSDATLPQVTNIEAVGLKTIKITFDEPVYDAQGNTTLNNDQISVKSGIYTYVVTSLKADYAKRTITATVGTNLIEGDIVVKINAPGMSDAEAIRDFAGLTALTAEKTFTYTKDTSVATATIESVKKATKQITIKFSKPVYGTNVKVYHSINGSSAYGTVAHTASTAETTASDTWTFTFINELPSGVLNFYLVNDPDVANNQLTDLFGVKVPNATFTYEVVADVDAPTVSEVKVSTNDYITVKFNEDIATAEVKAANFEILEADGDKLTFSTTLSDSKTVKLDPSTALEDNATYTVNVKAMKDVAGNAMAAAYSTTVTVGDNTNPTVANQYIIANDTIYIVFSEAMDNADLTNKANYLIQANAGGYIALDAEDTITVISPKKVKITWYNNDLVAGTSDVKLGTMKDIAGKKLGSDTTFSTDLTNIAADTLSLSKAELIEKNKIRLTFSNEIASFDNTEFSIRQSDNGATDKEYAIQQIESMAVNTDGKSEVVVILTNNLNSDATDNSTTPEAVEVLVGTTADTKSVEGTVLTAGQEILIADKVAPSIKEVVYNSATEMIVVFDEALAPATIAAAGKNGFTVSGGTLNTAVKSSTNNYHIILTGTDFSADTDVTYTAGNITDAALPTGNALATVAKTDQAVTLVATQASTPNATATLTFSDYVVSTTGSVNLLNAAGDADTAKTIDNFTFQVANTLNATSEANDQINVALATDGKITVTVTDDATTAGSLNGTVVMTIVYVPTGTTETVTLTISGGTTVVVTE